MKTLLKTLAINGSILFLLGNPGSLSAQNPGPGGYLPNPYERSGGHVPEGFGDPAMQAPGQAPFEKKSPVWKKQVKEVQFDGLPMGEVIVWLRKEFPEVNFISAPEVDDVPVRLTLKSVTLDDIFIALSITSKGELIAHPMNEKMVSFYYRPMFAAEPAQKKISRAFSLADYLSGRSPEEAAKALKDLEGALELSWEMLAKANPNDRSYQAPKLNLHAPTKMLIAVGDGEQLQVIERFVSQLERRPTILNPVAPAHPFSPGPVPAPGSPAPMRQIPTKTLRLPPSTNQPASTN